MSNQYADPYTRIRELERERDEANAMAEQFGASAEARLAEKRQAERERDEAHEDSDKWQRRAVDAEQRLADADKLAEALQQIKHMKPEKGAKLERAVEIARAALAEWEKR